MFYASKNPGTISQFPQDATFSTLIMIRNIFEHQISILERFLKDHVTLKTGVMAAENSALQSQE